MSQQNKEEVIKVYRSGYSPEGGRTFIKNSRLVSNIEEADIIVLPGGADIDPSIYGKERHHTTTWLNPERDAWEIADFNKVRQDQVVLGICRGAQLLCALFGGILVQNCHRHGGCDHGITNGEKEYNITSIHHQMMYPFDMPKEDYEILYRSTRRLSDVYEGDGVDPQKIIENGEPEIVLFHKEGKPLSLAVQGHPEMMPGSPVSNMISDLLISYVHERRSKGE